MRFWFQKIAGFRCNVMNSSYVFYSRLFICALSVFFLLFYISQNQNFQVEYGKIMKKYVQAARQSESYATQLQIITDRNRRTDKLFIEMRERCDLENTSLQNKLRQAISSKTSCLTNLESYKQRLESDNDHEVKFKSMQNDLKDVINDLKNKLLETRNNITLLSRENDEIKAVLYKIKNDLNAAKEEKIKCMDALEKNESIQEKNASLTKGSDALSYVENERVRFDRPKPLDDLLEFQRAQRQVDLKGLLSPKQLINAVKNENRNDNHNKENDAQLNKVDEDYKEM